MNQVTKNRRSLGLVVAAIFAVLVTVVAFGVDVVAQKESRSLRGKIYFSNNTPSNLSDFPVGLFTRDQKTRMANTTLTEQGNFYLDNLKPGKYLLKITNPDHCTLTYKVDLRQQSITNVRIVMDAACAHHDGKAVDLPKS
jgi:hypothetical protein